MYCLPGQRVHIASTEQCRWQKMVDKHELKEIYAWWGRSQVQQALNFGPTGSRSWHLSVYTDSSLVSNSDLLYQLEYIIFLYNGWNYLHGLEFASRRVREVLWSNMREEASAFMDVFDSITTQLANTKSWGPKKIQTCMYKGSIQVFIAIVGGKRGTEKGLELEMTETHEEHQLHDVYFLPARSLMLMFRAHEWKSAS